MANMGAGPRCRVHGAAWRSRSAGLRGCADGRNRGPSGPAPKATRLWMSSAELVGEVGALGVGDRLDVGEEFSGDVALEAAHDFGLGEAFGSAPLDIFTCRGVAHHAGAHDRPQRRVGVAVAALVE